jgi:hypothetical protein
MSHYFETISIFRNTVCCNHRNKHILSGFSGLSKLPDFVLNIVVFSFVYGKWPIIEFHFTKNKVNAL